MQFSSSLPYLNGFYGGGECSTLCSPGKAHHVSKLDWFCNGIYSEFDVAMGKGVSAQGSSNMFEGLEMSSLYMFDVAFENQSGELV